MQQTLLSVGKINFSIFFNLGKVHLEDFTFFWENIGTLATAEQGGLSRL